MGVEKWRNENLTGGRGGGRRGGGGGDVMTIFLTS